MYSYQVNHREIVALITHKLFVEDTQVLNLYQLSDCSDPISSRRLIDNIYEKWYQQHVGCIMAYCEQSNQQHITAFPASLSDKYKQETKQVPDKGNSYRSMRRRCS